MEISNRLTVLAGEARAAHEDVRRSTEESARRALDAGEALLEAQQSEDIPRNGFALWVENETGIPKSTAYHYIALFRAKSKGLLTLDDVTELGQSGALKAAAEEAERREDESAESGPEDQRPDWTVSQLERQRAAEEGKCVVANMRKGVDDALIGWALATDRWVKIDRSSDWGNPFEMPDDGERAEVVAKFSKFYLPHKTGLIARIPTLRGKVLGCWCHPEECHGHIICEIVNREVNGECAWKVVDELAEVDG